ncbi:MAG TPA: hypothetical protein VFF86_07250 [Candidatus Methylomirabilis sp.]|nr:hypothetical protein [Candidatus Methylomirabilis sp.]
MNLGIVTPELSHYGGSEVLLLECVRLHEGGACHAAYRLGLIQREGNSALGYAMGRDPAFRLYVSKS